MSKLRMSNLKLIMDESITNKLFKLIPEKDLLVEEAIKKIDGLNETDREWILNVFEKAQTIFKKKKIYYIINKFVYIAMWIIIVLFFVYVFKGRNDQHNILYYIGILLLFSIFVIISWVYNRISNKIKIIKLNEKDL